jgi:hypothetical protein
MQLGAQAAWALGIDPGSVAAPGLQALAREILLHHASEPLTSVVDGSALLIDMARAAGRLGATPDRQQVMRYVQIEFAAELALHDAMVEIAQADEWLASHPHAMSLASVVQAHARRAVWVQRTARAAARAVQACLAVHSRRAALPGLHDHDISIARTSLHGGGQPALGASRGYFITLRGTARDAARYFLDFGTGGLREIPAGLTAAQWADAHRDLVYGNVAQEPSSTSILEQLGSGPHASMHDWLASHIRAHLAPQVVPHVLRRDVDHDAPDEATPQAALARSGWATEVRDALLNCIPFYAMGSALLRGDFKGALLAGSIDALCLVPVFGWGGRLAAGAVGALRSAAGAGKAALRGFVARAPVMARELGNALARHAAHGAGVALRGLGPRQAARYAHALRDAHPVLAARLAEVSDRAAREVVVQARPLATGLLASYRVEGEDALLALAGLPLEVDGTVRLGQRIYARVESDFIEVVADHAASTPGRVLWRAIAQRRTATLNPLSLIYEPDARLWLQAERPALRGGGSSHGASCRICLGGTSAPQVEEVRLQHFMVDRQYAQATMNVWRYPPPVHAVHPGLVGRTPLDEFVRGLDARVRRFPGRASGDVITIPRRPETFDMRFFNNSGRIPDYSHAGALVEMVSGYRYLEETGQASFMVADQAVPSLVARMGVYPLRVVEGQPAKYMIPATGMTDQAGACERMLLAEGKTVEEVVAGLPDDLVTHLPEDDAAAMAVLQQNLGALNGLPALRVGLGMQKHADGLRLLRLNLNRFGPCILRRRSAGMVVLDAIEEDASGAILSIRHPGTGSQLRIRDHLEFWLGKDSSMRVTPVPENFRFDDVEAIFMRRPGQ